MATTSPIQSPVPTSGTPRVSTDVIIAIRRDIEPRTAFWQFELRPWHYWTAISSAGVLFLGVLALLAFGLHR